MVAVSEQDNVIAPAIGEWVELADGKVGVCSVTPKDRQREGMVPFQTRYVFRMSAGGTRHSDIPRGRIIPREELTATQRVESVLVRGPLSYSFGPDDEGFEDTFEAALVEALLGERLTDDEWPSRHQRWLLLAERMDALTS